MHPKSPHDWLLILSLLVYPQLIRTFRVSPITEFTSKPWYLTVSRISVLEKKKEPIVDKPSILAFILNY